jgi:hypothetical protein
MLSMEEGSFGNAKPSVYIGLTNDERQRYNPGKTLII